MIQKCPSFPWAKAHLKESCPVVGEIKFEILSGKCGHRVLWMKEERDDPACYQRAVQKSASRMIGGRGGVSAMEFANHYNLVFLLWNWVCTSPVWHGGATCCRHIPPDNVKQEQK